MPKRDASLTSNYKRLKAISVVRKWPLPLIDEAPDSLEKGKIPSTFDLYSGFPREAIHRNSVATTAIITALGLLHFLTMPQSHAGASKISVRLMQWVPPGLDSTSMYLGDVIVIHPTPALDVESIEAFFSLPALHFFRGMRRWTARDRSSSIVALAGVGLVLASGRNSKSIQSVPLDCSAGSCCRGSK